MKYRTISEQELPASHSSHSAPILSKLPPSTQPRRQAQYQSVCIQLHLSRSYSSYNKSTDVTSPCMGPCAGINRKMCQPWCMRKLLQKQASLPACQSLYPTRDLRSGDVKCSSPFMSQFCTPSKHCRYIQHLLPASAFRYPEFLVTTCFYIFRTIFRLYSDFMNCISNRSLWCTHLR